MNTRNFTHPNDAPAEHRWWTREGQEVTQLTVFDTGCGADTLAGVVGEGRLRTWGPNGRYVPTKNDHPLDLCDAPKKRTVWMNIYLPNSTPIQACIGCGYRTKIAADNMAGENRIACVKITYTEGQADD